VKLQPKNHSKKPSLRKKNRKAPCVRRKRSEGIMVSGRGYRGGLGRKKTTKRREGKKIWVASTTRQKKILSKTKRREQGEKKDIENGSKTIWCIFCATKG